MIWANVDTVPSCCQRGLCGLNTMCQVLLVRAGYVLVNVLTFGIIVIGRLPRQLPSWLEPHSYWSRSNLILLGIHASVLAESICHLDDLRRLRKLDVIAIAQGTETTTEIWGPFFESSVSYPPPSEWRNASTGLVPLGQLVLVLLGSRI